MHHKLISRLVVLATALCVLFGPGTGVGPAVAAEKERRSLIEIAERISKYAHCEDLALLDKAKCLKEFGGKAVKAGVGVALFLYATQNLMKDQGARFTALNKEVKALAELELADLRDPSKESDPEHQAKILMQMVASFKAAKPHLDELRSHVDRADRFLSASNESLFGLSVLTVIVSDHYETSDWKPDNTPAKPTIDWGKELREMGAAIDQMNAGFAQMDRGLKAMNEGVTQINQGLSTANKGITQANAGMAQINAGIAQANNGMATANKHVPGIKKGAEGLREIPDIDFDFSGIGDTWGSGSTVLDDAEQQRRLSLLLDLLPGVGDGKGIVDALTGKDLITGEKLSGEERALGALSVLRWLRVGGKILTAADVKKAQKGEDAVECAVDFNSFAAGTPVLLADGTSRPIDQVRAGDQVLATDPTTGLTQPAPVTALIEGEGEKHLVEITVDTDGDQGDRVDRITATDRHPFWTEQPGRWTDAGDLEAGTHLRTSTGALVRVVSVKQWTEQARVYNLTVEGPHTYYALVGDAPVLVHNAKACKVITSAINRDPALVKAAQQAGKNSQVQREFDSMFEQLANGNMNPGIGSKALTGTDVTYARGKNGARIFFRNVNGGIEIVAKADKSNEPKVIERVKKLYGK